VWERVGVLDVLGIERAHVVGRSMAGTIALILVDHRDRVESLTFVGTTPGDDGLPPMSPGFLAATADPVTFLISPKRGCRPPASV
jgi:pimeloyl-ACP methyl ester carboxylesterase